jgi:outer membrane murein-binding lipoprotein Lpp
MPNTMKEFAMTKFVAVMALGAAMLCGCDSMKKKDEATTQPKSMSTSTEKCTACETGAAKAK